jgi:hypothetical protein
MSVEAQNPDRLADALPDHHEPPIYKEFFPHVDIIQINMRESKKPPGVKRRPIYFGTIYVRDGRESAIVDIEGHSWSASIHGSHINRAFSGDRVAVRLLPRGHWKVQMPVAIDLNYEQSSVITDCVGPMNAMFTFEDMPDDARERMDASLQLRQLLFDDGFAFSQSGWMTNNTFYVTVTAGFTSSHDLNQKLASTKRKVAKPRGVLSIQTFIDKPPAAAASPLITLSALSDDTASPKSPFNRFIV